MKNKRDMAVNLMSKAALKSLYKTAALHDHAVMCWLYENRGKRVDDVLYSPPDIPTSEHVVLTYEYIRRRYFRKPMGDTNLERRVSKQRGQANGFNHFVCLGGEIHVNDIKKDELEWIVDKRA